MIKRLYEITIKDVILLDSTKSASHLKKVGLIPIWFFRKRLEKLANDIFDLIGDRNIVDELENDFDRIMSYRRLQILEALYKLVVIEIRLKSRINVWKIIIGKDYKESEQLKEVLAEVLKHTGIDIKELEDIKKLNDYIEYRIDKHKEIYPDKKQISEQEKQTVSLIRVFYSVFNFMGEMYNEDMRLITFIEMKKEAEDRVKKSKEQNDGQI